MIEPGQFYRNEEQPSAGAKQRMWDAIRRETGSRTKAGWHIGDRRSFLLGMAAAVLLYFAGVGVVNTIRQSMENSQPPAVRLDAAYRSAIEQFETVVPQVVGAQQTDAGNASHLTVRKDQLRLLDAAIAELKAQNTGQDLSPLLQKQLRKLYSLKLNVLQEMIENGEIEL